MKILMTVGLISCTLVTTLMLNPINVNAGTPIPMGTNRKPLTCPLRKAPAKGAPSIAQAKKYLTCSIEQEGRGISGSDYLFLIDDLSMQISTKPRKYSPTSDGKEFGRQVGLLNLDTDRPVYPIQGSYSYYTCHNSSSLKPGENCEIQRFPQSQGFCFQNSFDDWHCLMVGRTDGKPRKGAPPQ